VSTPYEPRPGSVAYRAIAHLESLPPGTEVMTSKLTEAIGAEPSQVQACLEVALKHGAVFRRQKDEHPRSPWWWSLTEQRRVPKVTRIGVSAPAAPRVVAESVAEKADAIRAAINGSSLKPAAVVTTVDIDAVHRRRDNVIEMDAPQAGPGGDGSQKPNGDGHRSSTAPAKAGHNTPQQGANRDASAGQSHGAVGSESPTGRGTNGAPALGAAPVSIPPLTREEYIERIGTDEPAKDSKPEAPRVKRAAYWTTGELAIELRDGRVLVFEKAQADELIAFAARWRAAA
jgi:hypothetical protein